MNDTLIEQKPEGKARTFINLSEVVGDLVSIQLPGDMSVEYKLSNPEGFILEPTESLSRPLAVHTNVLDFISDEGTEAVLGGVVYYVKAQLLGGKIIVHTSIEKFNSGFTLPTAA